MPIALFVMPVLHSIGAHMELDWLEDFVALAAVQNFSRAAEVRHVTQPAFSRRIRMLESWVGTGLFERQPRRIGLTAAGERFRPHAESILRDLRQAKADALDAAGRAKTTLTIAATHALSFSFFPHWVRSRAPAALLGSLNLMSDSMGACEEIMLRGEASFLLCHGHAQVEGKLNKRQFRFARIGEDLLVPLCAPEEQGKPLWPVRVSADSAPVPYLAYAPASGLGRILEADWRSRGLHLKLQTTMTARLAAALLTMAEDGQGVAWLPLSLATEHIARGALVNAGEPGLATPLEIVLCRPVARLGEVAEQFWQSLSTGQDGVLCDSPLQALMR